MVASGAGGRYPKRHNVADRKDENPQFSNTCGVWRQKSGGKGGEKEKSDDLDHNEERAAILEFDGGMSREEAERRASA